MAQPRFRIDTAEALGIADAELAALLGEVYVAGGFTTPREAAALFDPAALRRRGILLGARERGESRLAGMAIVVPPHSPARRLATRDEAELHLLGVLPVYRGHGLGRRLVEAAIEQASRLGCPKLVLWTQLAMTAAHRLYESAGFLHTGDFERGGRGFRIYELALGG